MVKRVKSTWTRVVMACGLGMALAWSQANAQVTYRTVALSGERAAGLDDFIEYAHFIRPMINDAGQLVFRARLAGPSVNQMNDEAFFSEGDSAGLVAIVREGDQVPGLEAGISYASLSTADLQAVFNNAGQVAFRTRLAGPGVSPANDFAIMRGVGGEGLAIVARTGDPAPGTDVSLYYQGLSRDNIALNNAGQLMFRASFGGEGIGFLNNGALVSDAGDTGFTAIIRAGDQAPGLPIGVNYNFVGSFPPSSLLNNLGQTAFSTSWIEEETNTRSFAIFSDIGGEGLVPLFYNSDQAAGLPAGVTYNGYHPALNDSGEIAFVANLTGAGVIENVNDQAIIKDVGDNGPAVIARRGDQAPGLPAGFIYSRALTNTRLVLNNKGQIAFFAFAKQIGVDGIADQVIFSDVGRTGLTAIARQGDQALGFPDGITYTGFGIPMLNDVSQMVFHAVLTDNTVEPCDPSHDLTCDPLCQYDPTYCLPQSSALYANDEFNETHLILAEGMLLDVNNDPLIEDFREINWFGSVVGGGLNNNSEIAFNASFVDGTSGVFVATIPSSCPLDLSGGATLGEAAFEYLSNTPMGEAEPIDVLDFFDVLTRLARIEAECP